MQRSGNYLLNLCDPRDCKDEVNGKIEASRLLEGSATLVNLIKILLVDDNPGITQMVAGYLEQRGRYELRVENDSLAAFRIACEFRPDVAILDVDMPGKDGEEVAREFKNDPLLKDTAIIFLSGQILAEQKGVKDGVAYLPKPFPLPSLERVVEVVLSGHISAAGEPAGTAE